MSFPVFLVVLASAALSAGGPFSQSEASPDERLSRWEVAGEGPAASGAPAELEVEVVGDASPRGRLLPVRVVVTASDGSHPDGSGRGAYDDGRFFADGRFTVALPAGATSILLRSGPNYVPLLVHCEARPGKRTQIRATLHRWYSPESRGWYGGDSHVHTQHDPQALVRSDDAYTALQGRAQGLSYISQASKASIDAATDPLSTPTFLYGNAAEAGFGPFTGHFTTPGITHQLSGDVFSRASHRPLGAQLLFEAAHAAGGIVTYTHPLEPTHLLHWMGATEAPSDAVLGRCADAFDIEGKRTELLWYALLNLGAHLAASSYTDCALERRSTLSPGDRRVYSHADALDFREIVRSIGRGCTFATNGGPVFAFFTVDGRLPGARLPLGPHRARLEVHTLYPLKSVEIIRRGRTVWTAPVAGRRGEVVVNKELSDAEPAWYVARAEDDRGHWAITSPIYIEPEQPGPRPFASSLMLEISNAARYVELRRGFFAHLIVTAAPEDPLTEVSLLRDGHPIARLLPADGDHIVAGDTPVTGGRMEYSRGWQWFPSPQQPLHVQADWPITETGWYSVQALTRSGRTLATDAVRFDAANPNSSSICVAHLTGKDTRFTRWGYGEEMPLAQIRTPFEGDHWWYFDRYYWRIEAVFGDQRQELTYGDAARGAASFRAAARP